MPTIQEIRQKYPQYHDMSDQQLGDALHKKYYSDMPKDEYEKKIGLSAAKPEQKGGIKEAIGNEVKGFAQHPVESLLDNPVMNALEAYGTGLENVPINAFNWAGEHLPGHPQLPTQHALHPNDISAQVGNALGEGLGFYAGGEVPAALKAIPGITKMYAATKNALSAIPGGAKAAQVATSPLATRTAGGAAFGASQSPENRAGGAISGALGAAVPEAAVNVLGRYGGMASDVLPGVAREMMGGISPETKGLNEAAGNLPVQLGAVTSSPTLQSIGKGVSAVPFSGAGKKAEEVAKGAEEQTSKLLDTLRAGKEEKIIPSAISKDVSEKYDSIKAEAKDKYDSMLDYAKEHDIKAEGMPNVQKVAKSYLERHEAGEKQLDESMKKNLEKLSQPELRGDIIHGTQPKEISFGEMHANKNKWGELGRDLEDSNPYESKIYQDLRQAAKKDMSDAAKSSGNKEFVSKLNHADDFYRDEVAPYFDNKIDKIVRDKANKENLHNVFMQDTPEIEKVLGDLSPETRKNIAFMKFKGAIKQAPETGQYESTPEKMFNAYNGLSAGQKERLFTPEEQKEFLKLGSLGKLTKAQPVSEKTKGLVGGVELGGLATALAHDPIFAAKAATLAAGATAGARGINKLLTSPNIRNKILSTPEEFMSPELARIVRAGGVGTMNALNQ